MNYQMLHHMSHEDYHQIRLRGFQYDSRNDEFTRSGDNGTVVAVTLIQMCHRIPSRYGIETRVPNQPPTVQEVRGFDQVLAALGTPS